MINVNTFVERRNALKNLMSGTSGIAIFPANNEAPMNYPSNVYRYRQDSSFRYFFSKCRDGLFGTIDLESGEAILWGDDFTMDDIIWMGDQPTIGDYAKECGVATSHTTEQLSEFLAKARKQGRKIHYLPVYRHDMIIRMAELLDKQVNKINTEVSECLIKAVVELRLVKSSDEIVEMDKICDTGVLMHQTVMKNAKAGITEQYLAGLAEGVSLSYGTGVSFPIILSQDGQTLHNPFHDKTLTDGRLLLVDMGAESESGYCSDYTRTIPVSGKFTQKQKDIYETVLKANMECIAMAKPNIKWQDVHFHACKVLAEGLSAVGLMKGNAEDAVRAGATSLFMPHGLGHALGMDVHDMEGLGENFVGYDDKVQRSNIFGHRSLRFGKYTKVGNVLTVEPGIYFIPRLIEQWKAEGKFTDFINYTKLADYYDFGGIRIEDDIVITDNGCRVLGKPLQKSVAELESFMR